MPEHMECGCFSSGVVSRHCEFHSPWSPTPCVECEFPFDVDEVGPECPDCGHRIGDLPTDSP